MRYQLTVMIPALLLIAAMTAQAASPGPGRVLVIYNQNWTGDDDSDGTQDSQQVAEYYVLKRGVPAANVLPLAIVTTSWSGDYASTEYAQFQAQMVQPIKDKLTALGALNIDILLMCCGIPRAYDSQSLDNIMMGLNYWNPSTDNIFWGSNPYLEPNPTFAADHGNFDHATYKFYATEMYLVTRLDTPLRVIGCLNLIDHARYADKYLAPGGGYFNGNIYIDSRGDKGAAVYTDANLTVDTDVMSGSYSSYAPTDVNIAYGEHYVLGSGFTLKWQAVGGIIGSTGVQYQDATSAETAPRAFIYGGWYAYNNYKNVYDWLPGSVACDLNSSSLVSYHIFNPDSGCWGVQALKHGATCVLGVVGEPYTTGHPRPNIMVWAMLNGFNFAEAAGLATPSIGWMPINIGDPLYQPMKPGKTIVADTAAPALAAGYPDRTWSDNRGNEVHVLLDDVSDIEVARAVVEFGPTTGYGGSVGPANYDRLHRILLNDLPASTTVHYRVVLTDPVGNVTTTGDNTFLTADQTPRGGTPRDIPGTFQMEDFDEGGEGVAYHDHDAAPVNSWQYRPESAVDLYGTSAPASAPSYIGKTYEGEWLEYTVSVAAASNYTMDMYIYTQGGTMHLELDGTDVSGPMVLPTGSVWDTFTQTTIPLLAGTHVLRVCLDTGTTFSNLDYVTFTAEGTNVAPIVEAGTNQSITLPTDTVNLDATVTDPDDTPTTAWTKQSGPGTVTFGNAALVDTTATFSAVGTYVLELTADDGTNAPASDTVTIIVNMDLDTDDDGMDDAWETAQFGDLTHDGTDDGDMDGLTDLEEFSNSTDPADSDSDNDNMPDGWEVDNSLNPNSAADAVADNDGDGVTNYEEYLAGTDPNVFNAGGPAAGTKKECGTGVEGVLLAALVLVLASRKKR